MSRHRWSLLVIILLSAAAAFYFWLNRSVIDKSYLTSEDYRQLEQRLNSEQERFRSGSNTPAEVFEQLIESDDVRTLDLPLQIDSLVLNNYQDRFEELSIETNSNKNESRYYEIGMVDTPNARLYLLMVKNPSVYRHLEVWMTTVQNGRPVDTELIAEYKKSLTDKITTDLEINNRHEVHASLQRNREYPIRQEYKEQRRFEITDSATIELQSPT